MVHLKHILASTITVLLVIALLCGCNRDRIASDASANPHSDAMRALVEANTLSSGLYHIEISGSNGLALFAYQTDVLVINNHAQWDGTATIRAYDMAFLQECHSLYSENIQAKYWRDRWAIGTATAPSILLQEWLRLCLSNEAEYTPEAVSISRFLGEGEAEDTQVVAIQISDAPIDWNAICDAHIDTWFGSQTLLTDHAQADATLCFDAETSKLLAVIFASEISQGNIHCTIKLSTADGHTMEEFPSSDALSSVPLQEEWNFFSGE